MIVAFATDAADGWLARRWRVVSLFGKISDPLADKVICLAILWLAAGYFQSWPYIACATIMTFYDVTTMALRFGTQKSARPVAGASKIAKAKTGLLMLGLAFEILSIATGWQILRGSGFTLTAVACLLSMWSLTTYLRYTFGQRIEEPEEA